MTGHVPNAIGRVRSSSEVRFNEASEGRPGPVMNSGYALVTSVARGEAVERSKAESARRNAAEKNLGAIFAVDIKCFFD